MSSNSKSIADFLSLGLIQNLARPADFRYGQVIHNRGGVEFIEREPSHILAWVGGVHGSCGGGQNRVDVAGSGTLYFKATNIKSLYRTYGTCSSGCSADMHRTLIISMYGKPDGFCPVSSILYAHVGGTDLLPSGLRNYGGGLLKIGSTPSGTCGTF